jgi:hypothetical protein
VDRGNHWIVHPSGDLPTHRRAESGLALITIRLRQAGWMRVIPGEFPLTPVTEQGRNLRYGDSCDAGRNSRASRCAPWVLIVRRKRSHTHAK